MPITNKVKRLIKEQVTDICRQINKNKNVVVKVEESFDDPDSICVRVFGVEKGTEYIYWELIYEWWDNMSKRYDAVGYTEDILFGIDVDLFGPEGICVLPMIKSLETTKEYYPEIYKELCGHDGG